MQQRRFEFKCRFVPALCARLERPLSLRLGRPSTREPRPVVRAPVERGDHIADSEKFSRVFFMWLMNLSATAPSITR